MVINGGPPRLGGGQPVPCQLLHTKVTREFIVDGIAPKIAGWSFIATLSWDGEILVTRTGPGFDGRIDACSVRAGECDHCHTIRQRYDTYLVERETGERKQVGSSCIKDFLGHPFQPSWLSSGGDLDTMEESFGRGRACLDAQTEDDLAWAASLTESPGWITRDKAEIEHRNPSSWLLRDLLFGRVMTTRTTTLVPPELRELLMLLNDLAQPLPCPVQGQWRMGCPPRSGDLAYLPAPDPDRWPGGPAPRRGPVPLGPRRVPGLVLPAQCCGHPRRAGQAPRVRRRRTAGGTGRGRLSAAPPLSGPVKTRISRGRS